MRALLAVVLLATACSSETPATSGADGDASGDVTIDSDTATSSGGCDPGCHWDCFGGPPVCSSGTVWTLGRGPRPCCRYGEPRPGPGPTCANGSLGTCQQGCATSVDKRYAACARSEGGSWAVLCNEGRPKSVGDACVIDADCRPAAEGVPALECDETTNKCVSVARPVGPTGYGATCPIVELPPGGETVQPHGDEMWCYVARDATCRRAFVTIPCTFDEDCPAGSVCTCLESSVYEASASLCLPTNDRTKDGRIAATPCASTPDAGTDGAADAEASADGASAD